MEGGAPGGAGPAARVVMAEDCLRWTPAKPARIRRSVIAALDRATAAYKRANGCRPRHLLVHVDAEGRPIKVEAQER